MSGMIASWVEMEVNGDCDRDKFLKSYHRSCARIRQAAQTLLKKLDARGGSSTPIGVIKTDHRTGIVDARDVLVSALMRHDRIYASRCVSNAHPAELKRIARHFSTFRH